VTNDSQQTPSALDATRGGSGTRLGLVEGRYHVVVVGAFVPLGGRPEALLQLGERGREGRELGVVV
jgi:hypothetical protein